MRSIAYQPHRPVLRERPPVSGGVLAGETVAVVVPCYKVKRQILGVIRDIGREVDAIYVVDDGCPEGSGRIVEQDCGAGRVRVIFHAGNQGVGGATLTGRRAALDAGAVTIVTMDTTAEGWGGKE